MNTLPQAPKSFDRFEGQDHGTRGNSSRWDDYRYIYDPEEIADREGTVKRAEIAKGVDDYLDSLSPKELEAEADAILGADDFDYRIPDGKGSELVYDSGVEDEFRSGQEAARYHQMEAEEDYVDELTSSADMGEQLDINTPARVRKEMARNAMLDPANDEDDYGDFPTQPVRRLQ